MSEPPPPPPASSEPPPAPSEAQTPPEAQTPEVQTSSAATATEAGPQPRPWWHWALIAVAAVALVFGIRRMRRPRSHPRPSPALLNGPAQAGPAQAATTQTAPAQGAPPSVPQRVPDDAAAAALTPAELAILAPLTEGSTVGPATVARIEGLRNGALTVHLRVGTVTQTFRIAKAEGSHLLHVVGPYTIYMVGSGADWSRNDMEQAWRALDAAVQRNLDQPVPPGMLSASEPAATTVRVDWRL